MNVKQAYLVGAFLTDGCVYTNKKGNRWFTLEVIDREFAENVQSALNSITGKDREVSIQRQHDKNYYRAYASGEQLMSWLLLVTDNKQRIPPDIFTAPIDVQIAFVAGMMDGDGYISQYKNGWLGVMGFAVNSLWIFQFADLLRSLGVNVSIPKMETRGRKNPLYRMRINKPSFIRAGLRFTIKRKQERLAKTPLLRDYK